MLNCKTGELAVVVKSAAGNEGKIVQCVEFLGFLYFDQVGRQAAWKIDRTLTTAAGVKSDVACDSFLRPIRYSDGKDEMLSIAGLPNKETVNG